jgi:hypothetical protein
MARRITVTWRLGVHLFVIYCTPSVPVYKDLDGSNFVPKYNILEGWDKIE